MKKITNTEINMQMLTILLNQLKPSEVAKCMFSCNKCYEIEDSLQKDRIQDWDSRYSDHKVITNDT